MKNFSKILFVAALAASFGAIDRASAGDNGILASPRGREMINVRSGGRNAPVTPTVSVAKKDTAKVLASPRGREMMIVRSGGRSAPSSVAVVSYKATGSDGITASPKRRQQLDEQGREFKVAPLK